VRHVENARARAAQLVGGGRGDVWERARVRAGVGTHTSTPTSMCFALARLIFVF